MPSFNITAGQTLTTRQTLSGSETGTIAATGALHVGNDSAIHLSAGFDGVVITNNGAVSGVRGGNGLALFAFSGGNLTVNNNGTMTGERASIVITSGTPGTYRFTLDNAGVINGLVLMGDGDDMLVIRNGSTINGTSPTSGQNGIDWLNYAAYTFGATVNLGTSTATGTNGVSFFENVYGGTAGDSLTGDNIANILAGREGDDTLDGAGGDDQLYGGDGIDSISGGAGNDLLDSGETLVLNQADSMAGGAGDDVYRVYGGLNVVTELASEGFDTVFLMTSNAGATWTIGANIEVVYLYGSTTRVNGAPDANMIVGNATLGDSIHGWNGDDSIWGQGGADELTGGEGNDRLDGGADNDTLMGGAGNDQLVGGAGADRFRFDAPSSGYDQIFDFSRAEGDRIQFTSSTGVTAFNGLQVLEIGGNSALLFEGQRIDVYGVTGLTASDFVFGF